MAWKKRKKKKEKRKKEKGIIVGVRTTCTLGVRLPRGVDPQSREFCGVRAV